MKKKTLMTSKKQIVYIAWTVCTLDWEEVVVKIQTKIGENTTQWISEYINA